jgi:hypothetical protein
MPTALGLEHAAIAQQRIEDVGEAAGEGNDGHLWPVPIPHGGIEGKPRARIRARRGQS